MTYSVKTVNLFGEEVEITDKKKEKKHGHAGTPGRGPEGQTC
jgi:hypothetical protein